MANEPSIGLWVFRYTALAIALIAFALILVFGFRRDRRIMRGQRESLRALGFTQAADKHYEGHIDGLGVWIEYGETSSRIIVGGRPRDGLTLMPGKAETPLGDPAFDRVVDTQRKWVEALAYLSTEARTDLARAVGRGWRMTRNGLERRLSWESTDELRAILAEGARLVSLLPRKRLTLLEGLLERLADDPHVGVRRRALEEIIKRVDADDDELARAVALCQKDPDPELRLFAARRDADPATLSSIALAASAAPSSRAEALSILLSRRPEHLVTDDLLGRLLQHTEGQPAPGLDPESAIAMVRTLGPHLDVSDTDLAARLRKILEAALRGPAPVAMAAIDTLAAHGRLWAVPHLLPLRDKKIPDATKSAATRAIDLIQARAGGDVGALSLTAEGGALALSEES